MLDDSIEDIHRLSSERKINFPDQVRRADLMHVPVEKSYGFDILGKALLNYTPL